MNWETPSFEEIDMSAEIGSYQGEGDDNDNGL
ncbi:MAG TPA: pyrroloquinoline quinone precursor peptide PqqA [Polyangiaceae bacterium]|nr:pyrroloquinoline quinone precursor peptide PqqA [Polyangiaceae bacterium]